MQTRPVATRQIVAAVIGNALEWYDFVIYGFLTLSLLGRFYDRHLALPFCAMGINYGLNRVRFTRPVRSGQRVRGRFLLTSLDDIAGGIQMSFTVTIEIDGEDKPACVAESLVRQYFPTSG